MLPRSRNDGVQANQRSPRTRRAANPFQRRRFLPAAGWVRPSALAAAGRRRLRSFPAHQFHFQPGPERFRESRVLVRRRLGVVEAQRVGEVCGRTRISAGRLARVAEGLGLGHAVARRQFKVTVLWYAATCLILNDRPFRALLFMTNAGSLRSAGSPEIGARAARRDWSRSHLFRGKLFRVAAGRTCRVVSLGLGLGRDGG